MLMVYVKVKSPMMKGGGNQTGQCFGQPTLLRNG